MQQAAHQTLYTTTVAIEPERPGHANKAELAKKNAGVHEQPGVTPDRSNNLTDFNLARLLASCGDCV